MVGWLFAETVPVMTKFLSIIGAVALGAMAMSYFGPKPEKQPPPQPPLLSLQDMGHLATVKVNYANVIEFSDKLTQDIPWTDWEIRFGGTRVLLVARGDCLIGTDIRTAKYAETDETKRTTALLLPAPQAISARVNHDPREKGGSYFYTMDSNGVAPLLQATEQRTKAVDGALKRAQQEIEIACRSADLIANAKKNTEAILKPAFSALGWKVNIRWQP